MIKTKIVVTVGPACGSVDVLTRLIDNGADLLRINFSHGNCDQHLQFVRNAREAAKATGSCLAIMGDLCGPKIRLGQFSDYPRFIEPEQELLFLARPDPDNPQALATTYPDIVNDVRLGDRLLIKDGSITTVVSAKSDGSFTCTCQTSGLLEPGQGINLPDTPISVAWPTAKDLADLQWAAANDLDFLALSFVRQADEVRTAREKLRSAGADIKIIAKIEKPEALEELDQIIAAADGILVARGDLGVEIDLARVPLVQKDIIRRCQSAGKPVIVATQMLASMISADSPTRAEVSDVANAIFDQADAVMLSGETAIGVNPVRAVQTIERIARVSEEFQDTHPTAAPTLDLDLLPRSQAALARGVARLAAEARCSLVVVWSQSGATAGLISKTRIGVPILALSSDPAVCRRMVLQYGVIPWRMDLPCDSLALLSIADRLLPEQKWAQPGDIIVVVTGHPLGTPTTTDTIHLHTVGFTQTT